MSRYQLTLVLFSFCTALLSQQIPIQFALTDTAGIELPNRTINVKTTLTSDTTSFAPEYQETNSVTTNQFGIASYWIGEGTSTTSSLYSNINSEWLNPNEVYYIVIKVDSTGFGYEDLATVLYRLPIIALKSIKSDSSDFSSTSDTALFSLYSDSSNYSVNSDSAVHALTSMLADSSSFSDSSDFSINSDTSALSLTSLYSDTSGYAVEIDSGAFNDSSATNEIQSLEQVLSEDSNAADLSIYNLKNLTIGDTIVRSSAALALNRTDAGFLLPRLTKSQRDLITTPDQGLMVYCTDCSNDGRVSVYDGNTWELLSQTNSAGSYAVISAGLIENITVSGASFNGTISDSGGTSVFAKGFCISSQPYPDLGATVISPSLIDSAGVFKGRAEYLDRNSKYYLRAYATNSAGTVYGPQQEFFTEGLLSVGDTFGGGIVGYVLQPGDNGYDPGEQHGIIVAQQDYGTLVDWGSCSSIVYSNSDGNNGATYMNGRTSEFIFDAYYNDSVWNTICADSLDQYQNYYSSVMHVVRDINWGGYNDWTVGTLGDYEGIFENVELLNSILTQSIENYYWTSSSVYSGGTYGYRYNFRFFYKPSTNSLTGITTYAWDFISNDAYNIYDYALRPIRYF